VANEQGGTQIENHLETLFQMNCSVEKRLPAAGTGKSLVEKSAKEGESPVLACCRLHTECFLGSRVSRE
jgi:hypothetical protein